MVAIKRAPSFSKSFSEGMKLYTDNFGVCFLATLVWWLLSAFALTMPPLSVGLFSIFLRLKRKDEQVPTVGDLFKGFESFLPSLVAVAPSFCNSILVTITAFIFFPFALPFLLLMPVLSLVFPLVCCMIADGETDLGTVSVGQLKLLQEKAVWMFMLIAVVVIVVSSIVGAIVAGIGFLFTIPLPFAVMASAYSQMVDDDPDEEDASSENSAAASDTAAASEAPSAQ